MGCLLRDKWLCEAWEADLRLRECDLLSLRWLPLREWWDFDKLSRRFEWWLVLWDMWDAERWLTER